MLTVYLAMARGFMKIRKGDFRLFFLLALFEPFLYFIGESFGLTYVSATVCSVLISTIPVFATIGAWFIFREKLRIINYAGIITSFAGVIIFLINSDGTISYNMKGILLLLFAVISAVGYNLTLSRLVSHYSPAYIVNVQNLIGGILFLPLFIIFDLKGFMGRTYTAEMFLPIIGLAAFASCWAFILFAFAVSRIGILKANVFTNFIPLFTALFSFILIGDRLTFMNVAGMLVVIAGIMMSQVNGKIKTGEETLSLTREAT
jgi:drug/metabolite transporter (DMT)-like permease